jgi:hypothetical protein
LGKSGTDGTFPSLSRSSTHPSSNHSLVEDGEIGDRRDVPQLVKIIDTSVIEPLTG